MTEFERDREVEGALRQIRTPQHREGFWDDLDAQLGGGVIELRPKRGRWLALAAAALVVVAGVAAVIATNNPERRLETADQPGTTTPPTAVANGTGPDTADGAVREWLDALGEGDIDTAVELTGPRTERYIKSLGGNLRGFLTEAQEGYGAWADSPDLSTTEVELPFSLQQITIVVVSGTWTGEGDTGFRTDALPVVRGDDGWQVEPSAFRSDTGGRIELLSPEPTADGSKPVVNAGTNIELAAPGTGNFFLSLNDGKVQPLAGQAVAAGSKATIDTKGLPEQTHLLVVAYVDTNFETITALAMRFEYRS